MVDHSAFDAHMFLIEAENKRILFTGDFRNHGFRGKALIKVLDKIIKKVDVLICEGTVLKENIQKNMSEHELSEKAKLLLNKNKYVFVVCASTNIDRLVAFSLGYIFYVERIFRKKGCFEIFRWISDGKITYKWSCRFFYVISSNTKNKT